MKAKIKEIRRWYNGKGKLVEHTILYESGQSAGCFENLPKTGEKWIENAVMVKEFAAGSWTCKVYRKEN